MKSFALSAVALSAIVAPALASDLKVINHRTIPHQNPRNKAAIPSKHSLKARSSGTLQADLTNFEDVLYAINVTVGNPPQNIAVQIDTGSSDLWFPVTDSQLCSISDGLCDQLGSYDPNQGSPTDLDKIFLIEYGGGTVVKGEFLADTIELGGATLTSVQFAACSTGASTSGVQGIMGIGYENGETTVAGVGSKEPGAAKYSNIVGDMLSQGLINSLAYSLWLNDPNSADGNVLFGGVDTDKFSGTLISMPVVPDSQTGGGFDTLSLPLTAISVSADGQSFTFTKSNFASPALIDSGTTLMYLPDDVVDAIQKALQVTIEQKVPLLPCSIGDDPSAKMTFTFNGDDGAKIDVLLTDLLGEVDTTVQGGQACELLISGGAPEGLVILGDAFMRSAYITYDLTNNMIAIAQTKFNVSTSNIKEINSSGIPGASVMSTLASGLATQTAAVTDLPPARDTGIGAASSNSAASTDLETTVPVPTFGVTGTGGTAGTAATATGTKKNAASSIQSPMISIVGALACTVTLMSFVGGAMMVWF